MGEKYVFIINYSYNTMLIPLIIGNTNHENKYKKYVQCRLFNPMITQSCLFLFQNEAFPRNDPFIINTDINIKKSLDILLSTT